MPSLPPCHAIRFLSDHVTPPTYRPQNPHLDRKMFVNVKYTTYTNAEKIGIRVRIEYVSDYLSLLQTRTIGVVTAYTKVGKDIQIMDVRF